MMKYKNLFVLIMVVCFDCILDDGAFSIRNLIFGYCCIRNKLFQRQLLAENAGNCYTLMSSAGFSTVRQSYGAEGRTSSRIFADYSIFKGKAALSAAPVLPTFSKMDV
ncbi:putative transcription factor ssDNA-binding-TF family [Helianthus debilis subsp. tardiflorus]